MRTPTITIETEPCGYCGKRGEVTVPVEGYKDYQQGELIQNALYDVSPGQRELLITSTHPECWDALLDGLEEDDDSSDVPPF